MWNQAHPWITTAKPGKSHLPCFRHDPRIGPVYVKETVRAFGEKVFDVIDVNRHSNGTPDRRSIGTPVVARLMGP